MIRNGHDNPVAFGPDEIPVSLKTGPFLALRSLLTMALAFAVVVLVNMVGGELADKTGFPKGGEARLAWDLGWVFTAGAFAAWLVARSAPRAPRMHAAVFLALMLAMSAVAVVRLGGDWPGWFSVGVLLAVPLQVALGMGCGLRARRRARNIGGTRAGTG